MRGILIALRRNARALKKSTNEPSHDYQERLLFELRRRCNQLVSACHPRGFRTRRLEKLVGPSGVWSELQQYQYTILTSLGLKPHHSILDIGCGPITVGLQLIAYLETGRYIGVDARAEPLIEAYRRVADHAWVHKNPVLVCSSTFGADELGGRQFDFIWMSQLSYHLDEEKTAQLFERVRAMMGPRSVFLLDVIDPEIELSPNDSWRGFTYHIRPLAFYEAMAHRFGLTVETRGRIRDYGYPRKINLGANILLELRKA